MSVFPDFPIVGITDEAQMPNKTYKLDMDNMRIAGTVDNMEAMQQAIRKALITPRMKCLAYDDQYGSESQALSLMNDVTREYIEAELPALIKDALMCDSRIKSVENIEFSFEEDNLYVSMTVQTAYGNAKVEGVI